MSTDSSAPVMSIPSTWLLDSCRVQARHAITFYAASLEEWSVPLSFRKARPEQLVLPAIAVGGAVEAAFKAIIAQWLPGLLADRSDAASHVATHLFLAGQQIMVPKRTYLDCRTIGGQAARVTLGALHPQLHFSAADVDQALAVRNAATHLGWVQRADFDSAVTSMAVILREALNFLSEDWDEFWGADLSVVAAGLADQAMDSRTREVQALVAAAKLRYQRLRDTGAELLEEAIMLFSADDRPVEETWDAFGMPARCPACGQWGWLDGQIRRGGLTFDETDSSYYVEREAVPERFSCNVCRLSLESHQLVAAGLGDALDLDPDFEPPEYEVMVESARDSEMDSGRKSESEWRSRALEELSE